MSSVNVPELVMAFINLWFTAKRLGRLREMLDKQYSLASRQTALAEDLYWLHKELRAYDQQYFGLVNFSPTYTQRYDCVVPRANVNVVRRLIAERQTGLRSVGAYHQGQMRDITQLTANALVNASMPKKLDAYKFEDAVTDTQQNKRFSNLANSVSARFYSPAGVYAGLGRYYDQMTKVLADDASDGLYGSAYHLGKAWETYRTSQDEKKIQRSADDISRLKVAAVQSVKQQDTRYEAAKLEQAARGNTAPSLSVDTLPNYTEEEQ